jgi:glycosyltransferase involved in cell wall biosynthesis
VSTLTPEKGHRFALEALRALLDDGFDFHWLVVGEGRCDAELRSMTRALGLADRVTFTGYRRDVARFLRGADVFLLPSLDEGLPIAVLEAMRCGPVVVGTRVGDVAVALDEGRCGFLASPGDPRSLANALRLALSLGDRRRSVSDAARERVTEVFSAEAMARAYCDLYDRLLAQAR